MTEIQPQKISIDANVNIEVGKESAKIKFNIFVVVASIVVGLLILIGAIVGGLCFLDKEGTLPDILNILKQKQVLQNKNIRSKQNEHHN